MAWLIFILGAALCGAGGTAIWSGISYMPVEWGWSQIIAGSTAVSAGIVTLALAAVVMRLGAVHRTLRDAVRLRDATIAQQLAADMPPAAGPTLAPPDLWAQTRIEPAPPQNVEPANPQPLPDADLTEYPGDIPVEASKPVDRALPDEATTPPTLQPEEPRRDAVAEPSLAAAAERDQAPIEERQPRPRPSARTSRFVPRRTLLADTAARSPEPGPLPWATPSPAGDHPEPTVLELPAPAPEGANPLASLDRDRADAPSLPSAPLSPSNRPERRTEPPVAASNETAAEIVPPTIVGRYQAGGASYALFSDGTIEVETETGQHRFGSMNELKQFLERQDVTARPGWPG